MALEENLERLSQLRSSSMEDGEREELAGFLGSKYSHAVAAAAEIVGEQQLDTFRPLLVRAFHRMMDEPIKNDPGCRAKAAIARALHELDADETALYLAGVQHTQMEPVWGGTQDTAMDLRTACGRGLVRMLHPDSLIYLADLLADPELPVRIGAAQSIAYHGTIHGLPMLRLKVLSGDPEVEVTAECLVAMMKISPEASLGFVAGLLRSEDPGMAESAALALGESRAEDAFEILRDWRNEAGSRGMDDVALVALAMLRSDKALEYLLELVAMEPGPTARSVIQAFSVQRHDPSVRAQVEAAAHRQDIDLKSTIDEVFYT